MLKNLFNEHKAAQSAAYFLFSAGGSLPLLKLMKLLYLAERRSFEKFGEPIIGDRLVSMPHGPVLSVTYNHMNGELESVEGGWDTWISDRANHELALRDPSMIRVTADDLTALSDADLDVLSETWERFGWMGPWQLRDYTHEHCPEWKDPEGSMIPMTLDDLFSALQFTPEQKQAALDKLQGQNEINAAFGRALR